MDLRGGYQRHHPVRELRLAQRALRPQEVRHLTKDLVHVRVLSREANEGRSVMQPLVEIRRPLAARRDRRA